MKGISLWKLYAAKLLVLAGQPRPPDSKGCIGSGGGAWHCSLLHGHFPWTGLLGPVISNWGSVQGFWIVSPRHRASDTQLTSASR